MQAVYQVSWSADSRLLVSGSADSTLKGKGVGCVVLVNEAGHFEARGGGGSIIMQTDAKNGSVYCTVVAASCFMVC